MDNWIYEHSNDNKYRYALGTKGERTLICIGVNPSTADPTSLDPTLKTVERIAKQNGYDSYLMLNLYPQRATNPKDMDKIKDVFIGNENLDIIRKYLLKGNCDIWAAWGTLITMRPYLALYLNKIYHLCYGKENNWYARGNISKDGHPHHPLYVRKTDKFEIFDIHEYIKKYVGPIVQRDKADDLCLMPILQEDLQCKDCIFRYDTSIIAGNVSKCEIYSEVKPLKAIDGNCDEYVKD